MAFCNNGGGVEHSLTYYFTASNNLSIKYKVLRMSLGKTLVLIFCVIAIQGLIFGFFYYGVSRIIYLILREIESETLEYERSRKYLTQDQKTQLYFEYYILYVFLPYLVFIFSIWVLLVFCEHLEIFFLQEGEALYYNFIALSFPEGCFWVFLLRGVLFFVLFFLS